MTDDLTPASRARVDQMLEKLKDAAAAGELEPGLAAMYAPPAEAWDCSNEELAPLPPGPPVPVRREEDGTFVVVGTVKPGPVDPYRDDSIPVEVFCIPPPRHPPE